MVRFTTVRFTTTNLLLAVLLWPVPAVAQEAQNVQRRNDCRLAGQALETGHPHPHYEWALGVIGACDESGGPALAGLWQAATSELSALNRLVTASRRLRDLRVLEATLQVASDGARETVVRLSALLVLATHSSPFAVPTLEDLDVRPGGRRLLRIRDHAGGVEGSEPLPPDTADRVMTFLQQLAVGDPDERVRYAAGLLFEQLSLYLG